MRFLAISLIFALSCSLCVALSVRQNPSKPMQSDNDAEKMECTRNFEIISHDSNYQRLYACIGNMIVPLRCRHCLRLLNPEPTYLTDNSANFVFPSLRAKEQGCLVVCGDNTNGESQVGESNIPGMGGMGSMGGIPGMGGIHPGIPGFPMGGYPMGEGEMGGMEGMDGDDAMLHNVYSDGEMPQNMDSTEMNHDMMNSGGTSQNIDSEEMQQNMNSGEMNTSNQSTNSGSMLNQTMDNDRFEEVVPNQQRKYVQTNGNYN